METKKITGVVTPELPARSSTITWCGREISRTVVTHGGAFHADDVFATALIGLDIFRSGQGDVKILRLNDFHEAERLDQEGHHLVYDIGGGNYDHHQKGAEVREDGTPYAAFGLLWRVIGRRLGFSPLAVQKFDREFISDLDRHDNTGCGNAVSYCISAYNSIPDGFDEAVSVATSMLASCLNRLEAFDASIEFCTERYSSLHPEWVDMVSDIHHRADIFESAPEFKDVKVTITRSKRGGYCVTSVTERGNGEMKNRYLFPESWRGKTEKELAALLPGVGVTFCHSNGFMAVFDSHEKALDYCMVTFHA